MVNTRPLNLVLLLVSLLCANVAAGQDYQLPDKQTPVWFSADEVSYDENFEILTATGNVKFAQKGRMLGADTVTYNRRTDVVSASGNVTLEEPTGEVLFASHMELSGDLREGLIQNLRVRLTDESRIAAAGGRRVEGNVTQFAKAVYTPCRTCADNPDKPPAWQIRASSVVHNQSTYDIVYRNAFLDVLGVPVFYTPYLAHADPRLERRSGFLTPIYATFDDLGQIAKLAYHIDIAQNMDLTVSPSITTKAGIGAELNFRHLLEKGEYDIWTSFYHDEASQPTILYPDVDSFRGHVQSRFRYDIDETWRAGSDVFLSTDDTFLRRYELSDETRLVNRLFVEGFDNRDYLAANAYYFQGLEFDHDSGQSPRVFPMIDLSRVIGPDIWGGTWRFDSNVTVLDRPEGRDTARLSLITQWRRPYVSDEGHLIELRGLLQTNGYRTDNLRSSDPEAKTESEVSGRVFPQAGVFWRFPLARHSDSYTETIEPLVSLVLAPQVSNGSSIPNEDSLSVELDDTNVLEMNRLTGFDRIEGNPRLSYGIRTGLYGPGGLTATLFLGQSYRLAGDPKFGPDSGLADRLSDIVGRLRVTPTPQISALYRFRLHSYDWTAKRNELTVSAEVDRLKLQVNYLSVNHQGLEEGTPESELLSEREEIKANVTSTLSEHWKAGLNMHRILAFGGQSVRHGASLQFEDDCYRIGLEYTRSFTSDREIQPRDWLFLKVELKTLMETGVGGRVR